jgi:hypothetical protein
MWQAIERFFFEGRWRRDERAAGIWESVVAYRPQVPARQWRRPGLVSGRVVRVYQRARHGTKALVDFGPTVGIQDTWWQGRVPPRGRYVFVEAHWWPGPGTHSGGPVIWIDRWDSTAPRDTAKRAGRHHRRMKRLARAAAKRAVPAP